MNDRELRDEGTLAIRSPDGDAMREGRRKLPVGEGFREPVDSRRILGGESKGELGVRERKGEAAYVVKRLSGEDGKGRGNGKQWGMGLFPVTGSIGYPFLFTSFISSAGENKK